MSAHDSDGSNCDDTFSARRIGREPSYWPPPTFDVATLANRIGSERAKRHVQPGWAMPSRIVSRPSFGRQREATTDVALAASEVGRVDGDDERLVASRGSALDESRTRARSRQTYTWNHRRPSPLAAATSSIERVAIVDSV